MLFAAICLKKINQVHLGNQFKSTVFPYTENWGQYRATQTVKSSIQSIKSLDMSTFIYYYYFPQFKQ